MVGRNVDSDFLKKMQEWKESYSVNTSKNNQKIKKVILEDKEEEEYRKIVEKANKEMYESYIQKRRAIAKSEEER